MGNILLLEDDKSLNRGISFKLKKEGYNVCTAFNIKEAKDVFPNKDLSLGCIRPRLRYREEIELVALENGVTRMEIPSKRTIETAKQMGYKIKTINACCALPEELEYRAITN